MHLLGLMSPSKCIELKFRNNADPTGKTDSSPAFIQRK